jgi:Tol biopolymer transport system component
MTPERWQQLRTLFAAVIEAPEEQRTPAYITRLCHGDAALVAELEALLAAHAAPAAATLDTPILQFPLPQWDVPPIRLVRLIRGTRLGSYEILHPLGAGGMGEVYCARDTKLGRDVALKILPDSFTNDPDGLARFRREAQVLAALNHPHIATIHGLEAVNGTQFLVLELVDGESLDERIARGPISIADTLAIARQLTDALEVAHEKGIVHRDLKPANIALTAGGDVKVLDFGLAKVTELPRGAPFDLANRPPLAGAVVTSASLIVGTPAYMAPEQACGKIVDKRADIWAFGIVVYEMLTGHPAFGGDSNAEVLAKVLEREPDWTALPDAVPRRLRRLLTRCLTKDPKTRLRDIGEARVLIDELLSHSTEQAPAAGLSAQRRGQQIRWPWLVTAGALGLGMAIVLARWAPWRQAATLPLVRVNVQLGGDAFLTNINLGAATILSPDGRVIAFLGHTTTGGSAQLYVRRLSDLQAAPLLGTDDAQSPFFSPDGQWIAFFAGGKLKKIPVTGGPAVTLCDAPRGRGGAWADDGTIVFSPDVGPAGRLLRVASVGGTPAPLAALMNGEVNQRWPEILPGGKAVLFTVTRSPASFHNADLVVQPLAGGERKIVLRGGSYGRYMQSGHLVYVHDGSLLAAPFDLGRLEVTGQPVTLIEGVSSYAGSGGAQVAVSATGTLVYLPGPSTSVPIHWMDHQGDLTLLRATPANWAELLFAPDGRRLALTIADATQSDIWMYEWARDTLTRLTSDPANDVAPVWTPDGRRIVFASNRADRSALNLYWQRTDGIGDAQRLTESPHPQEPASWHPSGKFLAFSELNRQNDWGLMILPIEGNEESGWRAGKPYSFSKGSFSAVVPMFSPDGRWIAYHSMESGRIEVYVRPFPGPGGQWLISNGGGALPTWSRTRRELYYANPENQIMVAAYTTEGDVFHAEKPRLWSDKPFLLRGGVRAFDLHPDGERFALAPAAEALGGVKHDHVTVIFNVFDELRRIAPATR